MQVLILEDEPLVANHLIRLVHRLQPDWRITGPVASVRKPHYSCSGPQPDLIIGGHPLSEASARSVPPYATGTAGDLYHCLRSLCDPRFKLNSIDYLLKPIDVEALAAAFRKYHGS